MTNSSKKDSEKKAAREILDSNLDARLDQATSTLSLDDEPPSGDVIDVIHSTPLHKPFDMAHGFAPC